VFRFVDRANYHVARIDHDAKELVVAKVKGGRERVLGKANARVAPGVWQELVVEARGDHIRVSCNRRDVLDVLDPMPGHYGTGGLWAPSSAEAWFDELAIEPLPATSQSLEVLPLLGGGAT
jgi:hypothetical protein